MQFRVPFRWTLSTGAILSAVAITLIFQGPAGPTVAFSRAAGTSGTGGTGGTEGYVGAPVPVRFANAAGSSVESILLGRPAGEADVYIAVDGLAPDLHDTVQLLVGHDPSVVEIVAAQCEGLFAGSFSPATPVAVSAGETAFGCGKEGGGSGGTGTVIRLSLRRAAPGEARLEILTEGAYGTRLYSAGTTTPAKQADPLIIEDPGPPPTATPAPTPTAPPAASGGGGAGSSSQPVVAPPPQPPGIPAAPSVLAGDGWVEVSWQPPANSGSVQVTDYVIRSADGATLRSVPASRLSVRLNGLENGREYRFRVQAVSGAGAGPFSEFSGPVVPAGPPSQPREVVAEVTPVPVTVTISWHPPLDENGAEVTAYQISEAAQRVASQTVGGDVLTLSYGDLPPGEYLFLVSATNRGGESPPASVLASIPVTLEQPAPPPLPDSDRSPGLPETKAAEQIGMALGGKVVLEDRPLELQPRDDRLRIVLPAQLTAPADSVAPDLTGFAGFQIGNLSFIPQPGQGTVAAVDLGDGLRITGPATLLPVGGQVTVDMRDLRLNYSPPHVPPQSEQQWLADSASFETAVTGLSALPAFSATVSAAIGPPDLPARDQLAAILLDHGWTVPATDSPGAGFVVRVDHSGVAEFSPGATTFSFRLRQPFEIEPSLVAIKQDDLGAIHVRPVSCIQGAPGTVCAAVFDGDAAGFSTFAVIVAEPAPDMPRREPAGREPEPAARLPAGTQTPPQPQAQATPAADSGPGVEKAEAGAATVPVPKPSPAPAATPPFSPDAGIEARPQNASNTHSVIVVIAVVAVGVVIVGGVAGYFIARPRTTALSLVIPAAALAILFLASVADTAPTRSRAAGGIVSQGDAAQRSDIVRTEHAVDGTGITVGIISDSFGCDSAALASDIAAGDLPAGMTTIVDASSFLCPFADDRGRALAQLIHDVAPGATIAFESALTGKVAMAGKILELAESGADIIIDDLLPTNELIFQDDVVAQTIDQVAADGVIYITSAGDHRIASYESAFNPGIAHPAVCSPTDLSNCSVPGTWHDFDPGADPGQHDEMLDITLSDEMTGLLLQWDQPAGQAITDLDLIVFDQAGALYAVSTGLNAATGAPTEQIRLEGLGAAQVAISHRSGPLPGLVKLVVTNGATVNEFATNSSSIVGHRNAAGAITAGPVNYNDTAAFGGTPVVEPSAPLGGAEILFTVEGAAIVPPLLRQKPDIVAPSGTDTTMGTLHGSPAAAAHTAGAIALLLQLRMDLHESGQLGPETIRSLLTRTAVDIVPAGHDPASGAGLIDIHAAATMLTTDPPVAEGDSYSILLNSTLDVPAPGLLANDTDSAGQPLEAQLVSDPANGALNLGADGSFTYTPGPDFVGEDSFSYVASDGVFTSVPVTVTITVAGIDSLQTGIVLQGVSAGADFGTDEIEVSLERGGETVRHVVLTPGASGAVNLDGLGPATYKLYASAPGFLLAEAPGVQVGVVPGVPAVLPHTRLPAGDANGDGLIDAADAGIVAAAYGSATVPGDRRDDAGNIVDLNGDGAVNGADLSLAVSNIGLAGSVAWGS